MGQFEDFIQSILKESSLVVAKRTFARNEFIVQAGQVERYIYGIESGAIRIFYLSEDQEEHTIRLGYPPSLVTSLSSFLTGEPSELYLQAIRKCTVNIISKERYLAFIHSSTERLKQYSAVLEFWVVQQMEREIDLLFSSPEERLKRVMNRSPQLFQEIPAKYIASYLRMSPETLSRLLKGMD